MRNGFKPLSMSIFHSVIENVMNMATYSGTVPSMPPPFHPRMKVKKKKMVSLKFKTAEGQTRERHLKDKENDHQ